MPEAIHPAESSRAAAYALWMNAPNPMVTLIKTLDVTNPVRLGRRKGMKFNMLMAYCVGKAATGIPEFYTLPVGDQLIRYEALAVSTIVKCGDGELHSCDLRFSGDLAAFQEEYLRRTAETAASRADRDLSAECMVIGTSAVVETEIDGAVGIYSGIYNNPFLIWGRYRKKRLRYSLPVSFQFHHTQMDGGHAGRFLESLQTELLRLR